MAGVAKIHCVAFIGKQNEPLFVHSDTDEVEALHFHFLCHSALDLIEERKGKKAASAVSLDMFLGLLCLVEDYRIYGFCTNTAVKIVAICSDYAVDPDVKEVMHDLHKQYLRVVQNPFTDLGAPISSPKFRTAVQKTISGFNEKKVGSP